MAAATIKNLSARALPVLLFLLLLAALYILSVVTENSERFGQYHFWLLLGNGLGLIVLLAAIAVNLTRLALQYRRGVAGSRLTVRLVVIFIALAFAPVAAVYAFSLQFLQRSIDSWFDVRVTGALEDALQLGRSALDVRLRALLKQTEHAAQELAFVPDGLIVANLHDQRLASGAVELTLFTRAGRIIASSSADATLLIPERPHAAALMQLRQGRTYVGLDSVREAMHVRAVVGIGSASPEGELRILHALYPMTERVSAEIDSVQSAFSRYQELAYMRQALKDSFTLTLTLVLFLSLLLAVWAAIFAARRLAAPISALAQGTRAVAAGDYSQRLESSRQDEMGLLVESFNDMTGRLAQARDHAKLSRQQVENQRAYLEAVLARLSSGVLTLRSDHALRTANAAAVHILGAELHAHIGIPVETLSRVLPHLEPFFTAVVPQLSDTNREWREELTLFGAQGRQVLMCRGAALPGMDGVEGGHVIVFDDVTALIQAQRDAAWGEVARRLAHEIKNPLTPIQLSAERLRHKYLKKMSAQDGEVLDSSTHTIVQQVEAMKDMVNAFSEYARTPHIQLKPLALNALIIEVLDLYRGHESWVQMQLDLDADLPCISADAGRVRQLVHNLVQNALEAMEGREQANLRIRTRHREEQSVHYVECDILDNGPGIPEALLQQVFEPYVTTKTRGTGLGLAIVKKIVEEHSGMILAENVEGGARLVIRLPVLAGEFTEHTRKTAHGG